MSDADESFEFADVESGREYGAVALVCACVLAVVLATALVPLASSAGLGGPPAESLIPIPGGYAGSQSGPGSGGGGASEFGSGSGGSGFGALNVGDSQSVGGQIDAETRSSFRSQDTEVHFEVRSQEPSYWRTGAFDAYVGDGWEQSGESDTTAPLDGRAVQYRVELAQAARSAPTVWRPVGLDGADGVALTDGGVARAPDVAPAGTTYTGESRKPPRDPSILAASGRDYPNHVEGRYTALPSRTEHALGPFTSNLTAGADNPYETASRIERWLEADKEYSLNVSEPTGSDVASQFVHEMDAGYCEYFATAMTAMLRTQDVPARYVVGYSTGQRVGPNTYQVRAMNAHAWVEVYFAGVGWVRFDPTPGDERLQQERQSFEESGEDGSYEPSEEGSPNETFSANESDSDGTPTAIEPGPGTATPPSPGTPGEPTTPPGSNGTPGDGPNSTPTPPDRTPPGGTPSNGTDGSGIEGAYDVSLNRSAVPGATVEISVEAGAQPIVGAEVSVNGERVGVTGRDGTVVTTVPYAPEFTVTVSGGRTVASPVSGAGAPSVDSSPMDSVERSDAIAAAENESTSFELETNATLSVSGDVRTGETVAVTATVDDVPVRDAAVSLDGEQVARTDGNGRADVTLPSSPGNVTLHVTRDPVEGTRTLELDALSVTTDANWPLPFAGTSVEVTAAEGGDPVAGVPVRLAGERVGETGVNGTLTATLPFESSVAVVVSTGSQTARTTVSNPLVNTLAGLGFVLAALLGTAVVLGRRGGSLRTAPQRFAAALAAFPRHLARGLVGLGLAAESAAVAVVARARKTLAALLALARGERTPGELLTAFRAWVANLLARLHESAGASRRRTEPSGPGRSGASPRGSGDGGVTVRDAWRRFLSYVSIHQIRTKTPGQIAGHAVRTDDLPADAVATIRDEFRAVEYGPRSADESLPAVESAVESIEATVESRTAGASGSGATNGDERAADTDGRTVNEDEGPTNGDARSTSEDGGPTNPDGRSTDDPMRESSD